MSFSKKIKVFQRTMARYGMYGTSWVVVRLPYALVEAFTRFFIFIAYQLTIKLKRVARETISIAFDGEKTPEEIEKIVRGCFTNLGQGMIELIYFMAHPSMARAKVTIEGLEHLKEAHARGKGVVAVTGHFGNFPLMMIRVAQAGFVTSCLMRRTRDPQIDEYLYKKRTALGVKTVYSMPKQECVNESLRSLRNNEVLFILMDQNFGSQGGVFVDFFGQKAATAPGAVIFAERTGAPIVPIFIVREGQTDHYRIIIEPAMDLVPHEDHDEMIRENVSRITRIIERYIRRYPQEWGWMHRRWKSKQ